MYIVIWQRANMVSILQCCYLVCMTIVFRWTRCEQQLITCLFVQR